jgi:hypothetical protein
MKPSNLKGAEAAAATCAYLNPNSAIAITAQSSTYGITPTLARHPCSAAGSNHQQPWGWRALSAPWSGFPGTEAVAQRQWHGGMHGGPGTEARTEALPPAGLRRLVARPTTPGSTHNPRWPGGEARRRRQRARPEGKKLIRFLNVCKYENLLNAL